MRALKILVVVLGLGLVAGFALLIGGLAGLLGGPDRAEPGAIALPPVAAVEAMTATDDRVVLHVRLTDGTARLYIIDPVSGALTAVIAFSGDETGETP